MSDFLSASGAFVRLTALQPAEHNSTAAVVKIIKNFFIILISFLQGGISLLYYNINFTSSKEFFEKGHCKAAVKLI